MLKWTIPFLYLLVMASKQTHNRNVKMTLVGRRCTGVRDELVKLHKHFIHDVVIYCGVRDKGSCVQVAE